MRAAAAALAAGSAALGLASSASARPMAYVGNSGTDNVTPFVIADGGVLDPLAPVPAGDGPLGTAATPDGRYLYVALNEDDSVAGFAIAADGTLTPLPGSPYPAGLNPVVPAVSPDGTHLYVANFGTDTIGIYSIGAGGVPTLTGDASTGDGPAQIAISPDGGHLFAPNFGTDNVSAFAIGGGGGLTPVAGSPFPAGDFPNNAAISPDGNHLYVSNRGTLVNPVDTISGYSVAPSGALTPTPGSPVTTLLEPDGLAFAEDGARLFVAGKTSGFVARYSVAANGALTSQPGGAATGPSPGALFTDARARSLFAVNGAVAGSVSGYGIAPSGLTPAAGSPFPTGGSSPTGRSVGVADSDDRTEVRLSAKTRQKVKGRRVAIKVKVASGEEVDVRVAGGISGRGLKRSKLKPRTVSLIPREPLIVRLKPKKPRAAKAIAGHLADGGRAKARVRAKATDDLGNVATRFVAVKLKLKRRN